MIKVRLCLIAISVSLLLCISAEAQHQTVYSNYVFNKILVNPAYVGGEKFISATVAYKKNWVGVAGSPSSKLFSIHSPLSVKKIALGLIVTNDQAGITSETNIQAIYSYKVYMKKHILSFGLQPAVTIYSQQFSDLKGIDPNDQNFQGQNVNDAAFNLGFGAYVYHKKYYIGLSIPRSANNLFIPKEDGSVQSYEQSRHVLIQNGYLLEMNRRLKFQPNVFMKWSSGFPLQVDLNTTFILDERLLFGVSLHTFNTSELNLGIQINNQLMFAYSYGYGFNVPNDIKSGAHEVMLKYSFKRTVNRYISTRYF